MDALEVLYDHYKETFSLSKEAQGRRNKSFVILCVLEAFSFFLLIRPEMAFELILKGINKDIETPLQLSNTIIQTLIWLLIVYVMIRYIQDMLYIERQYMYLDKLEKEISNLTATGIFSREGENYQKNYPMVLNFIDLFYKMLMPILFALINIVRIHEEWILSQESSIALVCDTILCAAIIIIDWFYFFEIHTKITGFCKRHVPFINSIANGLTSNCALRWLLEEESDENPDDTYPATPSSANPTIGSPHANAYTFSRLIFAAIFGKHKSPTISAMIANPKIEYRYSSWHTHLK